MIILFFLTWDATSARTEEYVSLHSRLERSRSLKFTTRLDVAKQSCHLAKQAQFYTFVKRKPLDIASI